MHRIVIASAAMIVLLSGCASRRDPADWASVREVTPGFLSRVQSREATLATDAHGHVALTFVTRDSLGKNVWLSISRDSGLTFSEPMRVNEVPNTVVSYPEGRPIVAFGPGGALAIAWSARLADSTHAVDLVVRASGDDGATFATAAVVNDEARVLANARGGLKWRLWHAWNREAYHGFPALAFRPDGSLFATWLDEREVKPGVGEPSTSAIYGSTSEDGGQHWSANVKLADSICSCCRPAALADSSGAIAVVYRRGARDVRDPALAISRDGGRSFALDTLLSPDGWRLQACPDQGTSLTWNRGAGGTVAWYTGAGERGVYLMPWQADRGAGGVKRLLADSLADGRSPKLASLGASTLVAVEARPRADTTQTVIAVRALDADGALSPWMFLGAAATDGWIAGLDARSAIACWTEHEGDRVRVRVAKLKRNS